MIILPDGFSAASLFSDFFSLATPFISISFLVSSAFLISGILKLVGDEA